MTIARQELKVKVISLGQRSMSSAHGRGNVVTRSVGPRSSIEDSFSTAKGCDDDQSLVRYGLLILVYRDAEFDTKIIGNCSKVDKIQRIYYLLIIFAKQRNCEICCFSLSAGFAFMNIGKEIRFHTENKWLDFGVVNPKLGVICHLLLMLPWAEMKLQKMFEHYSCWYSWSSCVGIRQL